MNETQENPERLNARSDLYRWFSSVFAREQDRASWELQIGDDFLGLLAQRAESFGLEAEAEGLADALEAQRGGDVEALLLELAVDYAQLFIGPGPGKAPPFESIYTSADGRLFGDAYAAVVETLHREEIAVAKEFSAPADHAAVELAVVAHLIDRDSGSDGEAPSPAADAFLREHVLSWFPRWLKLVEDNAATGFYRTAARFLAAFLAREGERVEEGVAA